MDKLDNNVLDKIEKALNIKFYDWQRAYLLNEPLILDIKITGRCTGKTLVYIIKTLFSSEDILELTSDECIFNICDWWSVGHDKRHVISTSNYLRWFKGELFRIYEILRESGMRTRVCIFNKPRDHAHELKTDNQIKEDVVLKDFMSTVKKYPFRI